MKREDKVPLCLKYKQGVPFLAVASRSNPIHVTQVSHIKTIAIRELHQETGRWVRRASEREIYVTERGRLVAMIVGGLAPASQALLPIQGSPERSLPNASTFAAGSISPRRSARSVIARCCDLLRYELPGPALLSRRWCGRGSRSRGDRPCGMCGSRACRNRQRMLGQVRAHIDVGAFRWLAQNGEVLLRIRQVYQKLPASVFLRATDAIHLATAAESGFRVIYSNDGVCWPLRNISASKLGT